MQDHLEIHLQEDLERLDGGSSAYIYAVNHDVVLKSPVTFVPPKSDSSPMALYEYALEIVCHHEDIENERKFLKRLESDLHENIICPVYLDYQEGIYLQRHIPLARYIQLEKTTMPFRLLWYRDMLCALMHIHKFEIAHGDVRVDNFLYKAGGTIVLCDFSCSRTFGNKNPSATCSSEYLGVNGSSLVVSDYTDRFALASVIFEIETGRKPCLTIVNDTLNFPAVETGDESLDSIIKKAWLAKYHSTTEMLRDVENLSGTSHIQLRSNIHHHAIQKLQQNVDEWRRHRVQKYGHILHGLCAEKDIRYLRQRLISGA